MTESESARIFKNADNPINLLLFIIAEMTLEVVY